MDEWSANNNDDRATAIWDRMLGIFGDALLRKFGPTPPTEWVGVIRKVTDPQIERGMNRLVFGWKGGPPNLPDFVRLCRMIGDDAPDDGSEKPLALPNPGKSHGDKWEIAANLRLMAYLMRQVQAKTRVFGAPHSPEMKRATDILVAHKKRWAALMRDWDVDRETGEMIDPPMVDQDASWKGLIESAEAEISQKRAA
jgi:hypothetical protein